MNMISIRFIGDRFFLSRFYQILFSNLYMKGFPASADSQPVCPTSLAAWLNKISFCKYNSSSTTNGRAELTRRGSYPSGPPPQSSYNPWEESVGDNDGRGRNRLDHDNNNNNNNNNTFWICWSTTAIKKIHQRTQIN